MTTNDDFSYLEDLNLSELAEMARAIDPNAHRGLSRETLETIIREWIEDSTPQRKIDVWRKKIFELCDSHWDQVAPLLSCPMKTRSPWACFHCPDFQVAECTLLNAEQLIPKNRRTK